MKKFLLALLPLIIVGCSDDNKELPVEKVISAEDKQAFKRCAEIVKGYGSLPEKFEYYPSKSTNVANAEGREVVTLDFSYGDASGDKIYHKAECALYPDGRGEMTTMIE